MQVQADQRPKQNHKDVIVPAHPQELYLLVKELGPMLNQENIQSPIMKCQRNYSSSSSWKSTPRRRWSDWIQENQRQSSETFLVLSSLVWRQVEEKHGKRRRKQEKIPVLYWFIRNNLVPLSSSRSFRTQSCWLFIIIIPNGFFQYIYHVGCAINLHSIINSGMIPRGQNLRNRQTVFFLPVDPMDKEHKDLETIDLKAPRHAQYMHTTWKKHQNTVYWVDIKLAQKKGLKFNQTRSSAINSLRHTPRLLYSESCSDANWRGHFRKKYMRHLVLLQRFPWHMTGWKNWVQKLLDNQREKLFNNPEVPNQANQIQTQIMVERRDPLFAHRERLRHVSLVKVRT